MSQKSEILSYEQVAQALFINGDTKLLLRQIKQNDQAAMVQLVMLHMDSINHTIKLEIDGYHKKYRITTAELKSVAIQEFMDAVKEYVNAPEFKDKPKFNDEEEDDFRHKYQKKIRDAIEPILEYTPKENCRLGKSLLLPKNIVILNKLNHMLTEKHKVILGRVDAYFDLIKQRRKNKDIFTQCYKLEMKVAYFVKDNDYPIHTYWDIYRYESKREERIIVEPVITEWLENVKPNMPKLDAPCCYLLYELFEHSNIGRKLWQIDNIWFDLKLDDQNFVRRRAFLK